MRTYWCAHYLAARGHEVHVVTNAKEARPPFRMHMRAEDWKRCQASYGRGSVTVHWTDPVDARQSYIPMASPFVSKLAATAAQLDSLRPFDVIYSFYMEPYGIAGHLAAEMTGAPHVTRMAGSDAGRLWLHPQLARLYDHVLRSAERVVATGAVAERAIERGVQAERIVADAPLLVPEDLFRPDGPVLDLALIRAEVSGDPDLEDLLWGKFDGDRPYFGVYGKLGDRKGSFALLAAMHHLQRAGIDVGLVALAHGSRQVNDAFRERTRELGLVHRVLQIPFLPHWRVPEFVRGCLAVCCLEHDFPIKFHFPIIPREILLCGACMVASTEVIRKLPHYWRLPDRFGCVAVENVNDIRALSSRLAAVVENPKPAAAVGERGRAFARELQRDTCLPERLEQILESAAARTVVSLPASEVPKPQPRDDRFILAGLAAAALEDRAGPTIAAESVLPSIDAMTLVDARRVLASLEQHVGDGKADLRPWVPAVQAEIAVAEAESETPESAVEGCDPLFRVRTRRWAIDSTDLAELVPVRDPMLRILEFDYDISAYLGVRTAAELPAHPTRCPSYLAVFVDRVRSPLLIDSLTARALKLSDGSRTSAEIAKELEYERGASIEEMIRWMESLLLYGLILLGDSRATAAPEQSIIPR